MPTKKRVHYKNGSYCDYMVIDPRAPGNKSNIAKKVAKRITSQYNQHITAIFVGGTGSGKSWAAMDLAYQTAREVAKIDKGRAVMPDSWKEYFNLDHMAIITLDRVMEVWKNIKPHGIYILDDIGVGYNNRDWMKDKNKKMNEVIQTMRTDNTFVIYTVPSKGFIDKVPRDLVNWYFEFEESEQVFSAGLNACKFLDITSLKRENKQLYVYDLVQSAAGADQFIRHIAGKPPESLTTPYEVLRVKIAKELREKNAAAIKGGGSMDESKNDMPGLPPSQMKSVQFYIAVNERRKAGMDVRDACEEIGFNGATYRDLRNGRTKWFTDYMAAAGIPLSP